MIGGTTGAGSLPTMGGKLGGVSGAAGGAVGGVITGAAGGIAGAGAVMGLAGTTGTGLSRAFFNRLILMFVRFAARWVAVGLAPGRTMRDFPFIITFSGDRFTFEVAVGAD